MAGPGWKRMAVAAVLAAALCACGPGAEGPVEPGKTEMAPVPDVLGPAERYGLSDAEIAGLSPDELVRKALEKSDVETLAGAAAEDTLSLGLLCLAQHYGVETPRDDAAAAATCTRAAEARVGFAMTTLAAMTRAGEGGLKASPAAADALLAAAAEAGDARAQLEIARARRAAAPAAARGLLEKCAAQGLDDCRFMAAQMQAAGEGGPKDAVAARAGYEVLAAGFYAPAIRELGKFWRDGVGVPKRDLEEAVVHFRRAAVLDDGEASFLLGQMAEAGEGLPKSSTDARAFYEEAAADGYAPAAARLK